MSGMGIIERDRVRARERELTKKPDVEMANGYVEVVEKEPAVSLADVVMKLNARLDRLETTLVAHNRASLTSTNDQDFQ